jgi:hypothetical protein
MLLQACSAGDVCLINAAVTHLLGTGTVQRPPGLQAAADSTANIMQPQPASVSHPYMQPTSS